jgi:hypothetical protein
MSFDFAIGGHAGASADRSIAIGTSRFFEGCIVSNNSTVIGANAATKCNDCVVIGSHTVSEQDRCVVLGSHNVATQVGEVVLNNWHFFDNGNFQFRDGPCLNINQVVEDLYGPDGFMCYMLAKKHKHD